MIGAIVDLVLNPGFHADVRAQMVFSVGHIIGSMKDYELLERSLNEFVTRLEPQFDVTHYSEHRPVQKLKNFGSSAYIL